MAPDRSVLIAELLTETEFTDDDARLCAVVSRWPDLTGDEFMRGLELALERLGQGAHENSVAGMLGDDRLCDLMSMSPAQSSARFSGLL